MNNEQIEQPTDVGQQAGDGQAQGNGTANGAYDPGTAEASNGQEGAVPSTLPGDMPGPLPEEAAESADAGDAGDAGAGGMDAGTTDAPVDLDTGHVDDTGDGAYAEASPASEQTAGADDVDAAGADAGAAEGSGDSAADAADASVASASAEGSAEGPAAAAPAGGDDSDEMVVRTARDPRMESVGANASMEDLLRASEQQYRTLKHNDVIEGTIMRVDRDEVLVDIGAKTEGIIPSRELQSLTPEEREALAPGDPILVAVVQPENNEGHALLSLDRARQERSWRDLQRKFEAGEVIQAAVSGHNKGGLLVNIEGVRGFVPSSQISSLPPGEANKQAELSRYHNQVMSLKIIEINRNRNRLILSERQAMQEQRESMRTRLLRELEPSQIRPGTVTSIADFGAFVDIGGADGLIHLSELSWKRVSHPSDVLKVGDRINVYVLSVDPNERKIALSLKRTQPEPWSTITDNYTLGQVVRGTITQLTSFGAFARLEDGIEGLIHVSELAEGRVAHPRSVVQEGQTVELKVIRIDPVKRRIGLSLKRMFEDAAPAPGEPGASGTEGDFEPGAVASQLDDPKPGMEVGTELDPNQPTIQQNTTSEQRQQPLPARQAQFQREPQQRDRDKDRDRDRDRGRREDRGGGGGGGGGFQAPVDDEPLGAMAQAFAAFAQTGGLSLTAEEEQAASNRRQGRETQASTAPEPAQATVAADATGAADAVDAVDVTDTTDTGDTGDTGSAEDTGTTTVEAALPGTTEAETTEDASTDTSPMSDRMAGEPSGTEATGDSGTADVETEASMPSTASLEADTDTDTDTDTDAGTDTSSTDVATDSGATDVEAYTADTDDAGVDTEAAGDAGDAGDTGTADVEAETASDTGDTTVEADDAGTTSATSDDTSESATASLNDVDAGEVLSDDTASTGGEEGGSDEIEASVDDTDTDTSDSGAASGAEGMPTVADAGPVDGEEGGSDEFNG